jgi:N-acetylglucosamine-6-sulfatase
VTSSENENYLPHWLVQAGYNAEYIGKFMNGYNIHNYATPPKGWTHVDALVEPYTYKYNNVVMSADGETPVSYHNYHQADVIRAKAIDRIEHLAAQDKPFYLTIAPTAPHFSTEIGLPVPLSRHSLDYEDAVAPKNPNYNPDDAYTAQKVSYLKTLPKLNATDITTTNLFYRARIQCLQGIDEIIEDVLAKLEETGALDNTYLIYTSDNGYHLGTHRMPAGKALPYREDTNLPFYVRGPGVPANVTSTIPSAHLDLAPTFLELAGLDQSEWPEFLDGRSLLSTWKTPESGSLTKRSTTCPRDVSYNSTTPTTGSDDEGDSREIINVEFWGLQEVENMGREKYTQNSYKTLRIVGSDKTYLYSRWCTNETELYDTVADPYELTNLALNPDSETTRLMTRLNAILLAIKSCTDATCRNPWKLLQLANGTSSTGALEINTLAKAMDAQYDAHFAAFPNVAFQECLEFQSRENEGPYLPENATFGMQYRTPTDNYVSSSDAGVVNVTGNSIPAGSWAQRNATLADIMVDARNLTAEELQ